ncbi:MAG: hypothetical protein E7379_03665 [Clostridiales bacterium]|nr:hypothetical protein [Clostridiales bacterium]
MKSNTLKNLALRAKNRLLHKNLRKDYSTAEIKIIDTNDSEFVSKVKEVISNEETAYSPLKYLMDDSKLLSLDAQGKERYLLQTIQKYKQAREQIERENKIC